MAEIITQDELKGMLHYDSETGVFTWIVYKNGQVRPGCIAGSPTVNGYWRVCVNGQFVQAHRLAWLYVYGEWPRDYLDHIDGNPLNNAIANLREATNSQNQGNRRPTTGRVRAKGVRVEGKRYGAQIKKNGKAYWLGLFDTEKEASAAYQGAARALFGEFARREAK